MGIYHGDIASKIEIECQFVLLQHRVFVLLVRSINLMRSIVLFFNY